jgi:hypothetical protein
MNKANRIKAVKLLEQLFDKWKERLYLEDWEFEVVETKEPPQKDNALLAVEPDPVYLQARIYIFPAFYHAYEEGYDIESLILHELIHCVESETITLMEDMANHKIVTQEQRIAAIERMTQRLTRAFLADKK